MNKYFLIITILLIGCKSSKVEIDHIELMAYNYEIDSITQKFVPISILYSKINSSGNSKNLSKKDSVNVVGYNSTVDKNLVQKIIDETFIRDSNYFEMKEAVGTFIYDGPIIRIKISYTNGKVVSFIFHDINYNESSKYYIYKSLYNDLLSNRKTNNYNSEEIIELKIKRSKFTKYANNKDTLLLTMPPIMPPTPKLDEVKFIKQPK